MQPSDDQGVSFNPYQSKSESFRKRNPSLFPGYDSASGDHNNDPIPDSIVERAVRDESVAAPQGEAERPQKFRVRIESRRVRTLDFDNLAGGSKFILDCVKGAKLIPDDSPEFIELQITQTKVASKEEECTVVHIQPIYE